MNSKYELDELTFEKLMHLIFKYTGAKEVKKDTRILQDLKITGDDALILFDKLQEEFDIDMTYFHFDRHFDNEWQFFPLVYFFSFFEEKKKYIPITISDLEEAVFTKKFPELSQRTAE
ncbi:MAG: DUF1493 family protein [Cyanobacteria bacterium TGS_CYA1]|nr:DUF1493 family protein [Cyanobacteria bacterium TGS_CYA1]